MKQDKSEVLTLKYNENNRHKSGSLTVREADAPATVPAAIGTLDGADEPSTVVQGPARVQPNRIDEAAIKYIGSSGKISTSVSLVM